MKQYTSPSMEVLLFEESDIVTASGVLTASQTGDFDATTGDINLSSETGVWSLWGL